MDPVADKVVESLFTSGFNPLMDDDYNNFKFNSDPIPDSFPPELKEFFQHIEEKANPFDEKEIRKGLEFFDKYAQPIMAMLGFLSLPYCYAGEKGVKVLYFSERIRKNPEKRLLETGEFVFDVSNIHAFTPRGKAYRSIGKVRLMHAAIRYHLLKSGKWNSEHWDMPINQEDMAGTNLAFSLISIRGLRKLGYLVSPDQAQSFITLWNWIGLLLGIDTELLPDNNQEAYILEKSIAKRNFKHSREGVELTRSLIDYFDQQDSAGLPFKPEYIVSYLLGPEISEMLDLKTDKLTSTLITSMKGINALQSTFSKSDQWHATRRLFQEQRKSFIGDEELKPFGVVKKLAD